MSQIWVFYTFLAIPSRLQLAVALNGERRRIEGRMFEMVDCRCGSKYLEWKLDGWKELRGKGKDWIGLDCILEEFQRYPYYDES